MIKSKPTAAFFKIISYVLHPIFLPTLVVSYVLFFTNYAPSNTAITTKWLITLAYTTIFLPLLVVFLLWKLNFISSIHLQKSTERIAPLIALLLFYIWAFMVFRRSLQAPIVLQQFLLGVFLSTAFTFVVNLFNKISLHTVAWGGVLLFSLSLLSHKCTNALPLVFMTTLFSVLVGIARYGLHAHSKAQLYIGYAVGIFSQCIAIVVISLL